MPRPLDNELLAWAAGFFDGEGSTIARTDSRRPDYFQLDVGVPQSGPQGTPDVLVTFQRAMLGVGLIYPQPGSTMFKWCADGRLTAELALALMWPWLGSVKRDQALEAIDKVDRQFVEGTRRARASRYRPTLIPHVPMDDADPATLPLAWAAGFLDAEGYFGNHGGHERKDGVRGQRRVWPAGALLRACACLGRSTGDQMHPLKSSFAFQRAWRLHRATWRHR